MKRYQSVEEHEKTILSLFRKYCDKKFRFTLSKSEVKNCDRCNLKSYWDGIYFYKKENHSLIDINSGHVLEEKFEEKLGVFNRFVHELTPDQLTDIMTEEEKEKILYALQHLYPDGNLTKACPNMG